MQVLAEVRKVRHFNGSKLKAEVSLIVSDPDEILRVRLFDVHEKQGLIDQFQKLEGKLVRVPLEIEIYQGRLSYSLSYGSQPAAIDAK
jgi:hypothetical protein